MLADRFWGGGLFFVGNDIKWDLAHSCIKELRTDYLESGDIIVYYEVTETAGDVIGYEPKRSTVMVYNGEKLLSAEDNMGEVKHAVYEGADIDAQFLRAFVKTKGVEECHLFFVLRPSQAK